MMAPLHVVSPDVEAGDGGSLDAEATSVRAEVFASLRFNSNGPSREAAELKRALAAEGVKLHVIDTKPGQNITDKVFETLERADAFLAMATADYGEDTGNPASTYHEVQVRAASFCQRLTGVCRLSVVASCSFHGAVLSYPPHVSAAVLAVLAVAQTADPPAHDSL